MSELFFISVDCQLLKQMGAKSAGCSVACSDLFQLPICMAWGDLTYYNLELVGEMVAMGHEARIWEEDDSVLSH